MEELSPPHVAPPNERAPESLERVTVEVISHPSAASNASEVVVEASTHHLADHYGLSIPLFLLSTRPTFQSKPTAALSTGKRKVFQVVHGLNELLAFDVAQRVGIVDNPMTVAYIESTQLIPSCLKRNCPFVTIAIS